MVNFITFFSIGAEKLVGSQSARDIEELLRHS